MKINIIKKQAVKKIEPITCDCCGELYWPIEDVCRLLEIRDVDQALAFLDPDDHNEMMDDTAVVTTNGLFSLIQHERLMLKRLVAG